MVLDVRGDSVVTPDLDRIPRTALPPGALVILFSPLLDERAIGASPTCASEDSRWSSSMCCVTSRPSRPAPRLSALAVRVWRLDRAALRSSLAALGVPVVTWDSDDELDPALAPLRRAAVPSAAVMRLRR